MWDSLHQLHIVLELFLGDCAKEELMGVREVHLVNLLQLLLVTVLLVEENSEEDGLACLGRFSEDAQNIAHVHGFVAGGLDADVLAFFCVEFRWDVVCTGVREGCGIQAVGPKNLILKGEAVLL